MKTRTLLLLAVGVGLAILLAGGVFLLQLSNESATVDLAAVGEPAQVGDVAITVDSASETSGTFAVTITIGGVDDPDGLDSFRLVTGGEPLSPIAAPAPGRCDAITETTRECRLDFDLSATDATNRVLVLRRGDEQLRWDLAGA